MAESKLIILCGEAFAGKSTLAKQLAERLDLKIVGRDEIYFATNHILALDHTPDEDDSALWKALWPIVVQGIKNHLMLGNSVVVDDNCIRRSERDDLRNIASKVGAKSALVYMDISSEVLKERKEKNKISKERHDVPSAWMLEDSAEFERPTESENPIIYKEGMPINELVKSIEYYF